MNDFQFWLQQEKLHSSVPLIYWLFTAYFLRVNLSLRIVSMTSNSTSNVNFHVRYYCINLFHVIIKSYELCFQLYILLFRNLNGQKSLILSSFFWGYLFGQYFHFLLLDMNPKLLLVIPNVYYGNLCCTYMCCIILQRLQLLCVIN